MKKVFIALLIVLSAGCSDSVDNKQEAELPLSNVDENDFVRKCIDTAADIESSSNELEHAIDRIDFKNTGWQNELQSIATDLTIATNNYANETSVLNDELSNRFSETITLYDEGIAIIREATDLINQGLESYDKDELLKITPLLLEGNKRIESALEKLEEERDS